MQQINEEELDPRYVIIKEGYTKGKLIRQPYGASFHCPHLGCDFTHERAVSIGMHRKKVHQWKGKSQTALAYARKKAREARAAAASRRLHDAEELYPPTHPEIQKRKLTLDLIKGDQKPLAGRGYCPRCGPWDWIFTNEIGGNQS